jgi:hypothetical protein
VELLTVVLPFKREELVGTILDILDTTVEFILANWVMFTTATGVFKAVVVFNLDTTDMFG